MDKNQEYLLELMQHNNNDIESLRTYAEENRVPIVDKMSLEAIKQVLRLKQPRHILELGTAIGYSAMQFASVSSDIHITTIERDTEMQDRASQNIEHFGYQQQITMIKGDAREQFETLKDKTFDVIFIDAAKAQTQRFFETYEPLLKLGGVVITDNILYHDFVADIDVIHSRNVRQMVKKLQKYNEWLVQHPRYETNFLNIDDGVAISVKKEN
ncbi:O-methyltransferase [Staphylococcus pettenkoferi]|uniref:O-methyltransferase n=1 Tax=Staphylococcus pettenkoferi TaxID=170573 RepID=UPI0002432B44|nr:O-methyltransferase [Staphylococcus pettenkoferi]EHM72210.1 cephalosporin hydroxylase [Staphylococcus pettenkoferi VCU012]MCY1579814.1 O-methyltransferase [Staphylococcus pettenkoferi]MCY1620277.1 O-methyltransferase [Staphylococcus pettenkoferi]